MIDFEQVADLVSTDDLIAELQRRGFSVYEPEFPNAVDGLEDCSDWNVETKDNTPPKGTHDYI